MTIICDAGTSGLIALPALTNAHEHGLGFRGVSFGAPHGDLETFVAGLRHEPKVDVMHVPGAGGWTALVKVRFPFAVRYIFAGLRSAATGAILAAMLAEWLSGAPGLGTLLLDAALFRKTGLLWAGVIVSVAIGYPTFALTAALEARLSGGADDVIPALVRKGHSGDPAGHLRGGQNKEARCHSAASRLCWMRSRTSKRFAARVEKPAIDIRDEPPLGKC